MPQAGWVPWDDWKRWWRYVPTDVEVEMPGHLIDESHDCLGSDGRKWTDVGDERGGVSRGTRSVWEDSVPARDEFSPRLADKRVRTQRGGTSMVRGRSCSCFGRARSPSRKPMQRGRMDFQRQARDLQPKAGWCVLGSLAASWDERHRPALQGYEDLPRRTAGGRECR